MDALTVAQKNRTFRSRVLIASVLSAAMCAAIIVWASPAPLYYEPTWEGVAACYQMAAGQSSAVHFYYSGRFLHPFVVRAHIRGISHIGYAGLLRCILRCACSFFACASMAWSAKGKVTGASGFWPRWMR